MLATARSQERHLPRLPGGWQGRESSQGAHQQAAGQRGVGTQMQALGCGTQGCRRRRLSHPAGASPRGAAAWNRGRGFCDAGVTPAPLAPRHAHPASQEPRLPEPPVCLDGVGVCHQRLRTRVLCVPWVCATWAEFGDKVVTVRPAAAHGSPSPGPFRVGAPGSCSWHGSLSDRSRGLPETPLAFTGIRVVL